MNKSILKKIEHEYQVQKALEEFAEKRFLRIPKTSRATMIIFTIILIVLFASVVFIVECFFFSRTLKILLYPIFILLLCESYLKLFLIKAVECYQHYANEETRRRCLCVPSCSEYAISVIKRFVLIIAVYKIYRRLFRICRGDMYCIDLPYKKYKLSPDFEKMRNEVINKMSIEK